MILTRTIAPAKLPITLNEARAHARVAEGDSDEDPILAGYLRAAVAFFDGADGCLNRALITQTWELRLARFPARTDMPIEIPLAPLQSVSSIVYTDGDGVAQTWDSSEYQVDASSEPGRVRPEYNFTWPTVRAETLNAVTITFVCGYGPNAGDVPEGVRLAIAHLATHFYSEREILAPGMVNRVPSVFTDIVGNYRLPSVV